MVVADGRAHIRYQNFCNYRDVHVWWFARFGDGLINVMIIIIKKCLF